MKKPSNQLFLAFPLLRAGLLSLCALAFMSPSAWAQCQTNPGSVEVGRCFEGTLVANGTYVNAYRDVDLEVTFQRARSAHSFTVQGFWDGGQNFRFRTAFPLSGGWTWSSSCSGGGCALDTGLDDRGGDVRVVVPASTNSLYAGGFLRVDPNERFLRSESGTPFFWLGDTSWAGPLRASNQEWDTYLDDRKAKGFTVVQVALPADWMDVRGQQPKDFLGRVPFTQVPSCSSTTALPNACSRWSPAFWRTFARKVQAANDRGFLVVVVGLMERLLEGNGGAAYPLIADSKVYARNIAARLSGHYVIFSPSFDTRPGINPASCSASSTNISCRMRFVGQEIRDTAPRHLITNHWGGRTAASEMQPFQGEAWLDFQLFQSGQQRGASNCNINTQLSLITQRPREVALALSGYTPTKPNINGEAIYDAFNGDCLGTTHYNPYRARQAGYLSLLSGAVGYTFGVKGVFDWEALFSQPQQLTWESGKDRRSSTEMTFLGNAFRSVDWSDLVPEHGRILNQASAQHQKMVLARDVSKQFLVAYLPDNPTIRIGFSNINTVPKTGQWINPRTGAQSTAAGVQQANPLHWEFTRPACGGGDPNCGSEPDWLLILD